MKVIIAGSRNLWDSDKLVQVAMLIFNKGPDEVVCGGCPGIDIAGWNWAKEWGDISTKMFTADWNKHGKSAGPIRNEEMAEYADALVAIWDGESRGTWDMIRRADKHELRILVVTVAP